MDLATFTKTLNLPKSWWKLGNQEELISIISKLYNTTFTPEVDKVFRAFRYFNPKDCRAIIIGQDPYLTGADGLAFSRDSIKGSLGNIIKALQNTGIDTSPPKGRLDRWAQQGILLLNTCLTLDKFWVPWTKSIVAELVKMHNNLYILAWGRKAEALIDFDIGTNTLLTWLHPSPIAQPRAAPERKFEKCPHFGILQKKLGIDWRIADYDYVFASDGAANKKGSGYAYVFAKMYEGKKCVYLGEHAGKLPGATNNQAELIGLILALEKLVGKKGKCLAIVDSTYLIKCWNNCMKSPDRYKNPALLKKMFAISEKLECEIDFMHVRSHQPKPTFGVDAWRLNKHADKLATI